MFTVRLYSDTPLRYVNCKTSRFDGNLRSVKAKPEQRMLVHGASGDVGSAMLQLAKLAGVEMYGTCSGQGAAVVLGTRRHPHRPQKRRFRRRLTLPGPIKAESPPARLLQ
jgi:hypothetical protein